MAMMKKRPFRRRTSATLNNRIRRIDRDIERKTLGKWYGVNESATLTTGSTKLGLFIPLPRPSNKVEVYGMDMLLSLVVDQGDNDSNILQGALLVCHDREGQDPSDFVGPSESMPKNDGWDNLARPRSFLPFTLVGQPGVSQRIAIVPYRFFRGHKIVLNPAQRLIFYLTMASDTPAGLKIEFAIHGRYRFIQTHS